MTRKAGLRIGLCLAAMACLALGVWAVTQFATPDRDPNTPTGAGGSPGGPSAGGFTGSVGCRECHEPFYKLWASSHHGLAMQPFTAELAQTKLTAQTESITIGRHSYRAEFGGEAPGIFTSNQYDAVILIALGIARAGADATPGAIRTAIREIAGGTMALPNAKPVVPEQLSDALQMAAAGAAIDYSGASGELDLDEHGDVLTDYGVWEVSGSAIADTADVWTCTLGATAAAVPTCVIKPNDGS